MFKQISEPNQHFSAYHEDNSLLIQFMMVEFVQTYQLTFQIKVLIQEHLNSNHASDVFNSLVQILGQLVGCFPQQGRSSFCRWTKGSLTKLKEYAEQFSRNSAYQNKQHIHLHMASHQAWLTAMHYLELLNSLHIIPQDQANAALFMLPLKSTFNTLQARFNKVVRYLPRVMNQYCHNENVLLCLLRKKTQFIEIYGSDFFYKRFKWPIKSKDLMKLLVQRYQSRGFENLVPTIQQILEAQEKIHGTY